MSRKLNLKKFTLFRFQTVKSEGTFIGGKITKNNRQFRTLEVLEF